MVKPIDKSLMAIARGIEQLPGLSLEQRATSQNWTEAPYNRWSFQRVQQFTSTVRVTRSPEPLTISAALQDFSELGFLDSQGSHCTIAQMLDRTWTDGFLVMHKGQILTENYLNGMRADSLHLIMSCSKSFLSTLFGIYVDRGDLDPDQQIERYLPELIGSGIEGATLQNLLDMQVGVKFNEDYDDLDSDLRQSEIATGWRQSDGAYDGPTDMLSYASTLRSDGGAHGDVFHYQSVLTNMLGCALERVTGRRFADLFAEHVWHPIGSEQDLVSISDAAGYASFEGGFNVCLRDFARFGQLICDNGRVNQTQVVPESWISECRYGDEQLVDAFARGEYAEVIKGGAYHNKWWQRDPQNGIIMALGIHGQIIYINPEINFVAVKMSTHPGATDIEFTVDQMLGIEAIAENLIDQEAHGH